MGVETRTTFCRICEAACGLEVDVAGDEIVAVRPDRAHVASRGYLCVKGPAYREVHGSPDRVLRPQRREGTRWREEGWDEALAAIGERIRRIRGAHGPDAVAVYVGNPAAFSTTHAIFAQAFVAGLGTRHLFTAGSQDCNNKFVVAEEMYGSPALQPVPDLDHAGCVIVLGSNPAVSQMSFANVPRPIERLRGIVERGGRVFIVDPRKTESAQAVGEHVPIRPGTDVFLLLSLLQVLVERGAIRGRDGMRGAGALAAVGRPWPPERTAEVTGVPAGRVREMAAEIADARSASLYCSTGINQGGQGTLAFWLAQAITAATGNLDRRGGAVVPPGLLDLPRFAQLAGIWSRREPGAHGYRPVLGSLPAGLLADLIESGTIRALIVDAGNPVLSCPNSDRLARALGKLELLVAVDLFRNETGDLAHWVLPAQSAFEHPDLPLASQGFAAKPWVQYTDALVAPRGQAREEWQIFLGLARASGLRLFRSRIAQTTLGTAVKLGLGSRGILAAILAASRRTTLGKLRRHPHGLELDVPVAGTFLRRRVLTGDRLVDLAPPAFVAAAASLDRVLEEEQAALARGELRLITKRERHSHNSWMHNAPSLVRHRRGNALHIHPTDAAARELRADDRADVRTPSGAVVVPVELDDTLCPGTVALPHGWGHTHATGLTVARAAGGANANILAADGPDALERLSGMARLTAIPVEVSRAHIGGGQTPIGGMQ